MTDYRPPLEDMRFVFRALGAQAALARLPGFEEVTAELVDQVLEEAGRFAAGALAPLDRSGDLEGVRLENGVVRTPAGFAEAYRAFVEAGWNGIAADPGFGGQGLPQALALATTEMWNAANMSFALCPLLTQGAIELLAAHGSEAQKALYLEKLVSGEWSGTMCLTEPQAGTDLGLVRSRAEPTEAGWRLRGTKVFITYGDHEMAENIVHMVLARTPEAPAGVKGLSLFLVPKFLPDEAGRPGRRNDLRAVSLERKLGIHASPTAVMSFGDDEGAAAELVGERHGGIAAMFVMMNNARIAVGVQGLAVAERAYQRALAYARERRQGRRLSDGAEARLIEHPDVRRMLMTIKAHTETMRALIARVGVAIDTARHHPDAETRARAERRVGLLTPVVKAHCTDTGFALASEALQVHGGAGYIEETGAAQQLRDARITPIYEGTNGVQALDLVRRKLVADDGLAVAEFLAEVTEVARRLMAVGPPLAPLRRALAEAAAALGGASEWLRQTWPEDPERAAAGATDYARMFGLVACGREAAETALAALGHDDPFHRAKLATARFYGERALPLVAPLRALVESGGDSFTALDEA